MGMIITDRMTAKVDGPFVVFLIGMRINKPFKFGAWVPVARAMARALDELNASPADSGFMGSTALGMFSVLQHWRSFEDLEAYANDAEKAHWPAWQEFNRRVKLGGRGAVGIWHETYLIEAGAYENLYSGMPAHGLGKCGALIQAGGPRKDARGRIIANN